MLSQKKINKLLDIEETNFYTIEELAPLLRVSNTTLRRYCCNHVFPHATKFMGKNWLIPGCDIINICPHLNAPDNN
jgi:hypothetical protein